MRRYFLTLSFVILLGAICPYILGAATTEIEEEHPLEISSLHDGGQTGAIVEIAAVPTDVLQSPEFSSLLRAYTEDIIAERRQTECRLWIDVERYKAQHAASESLSEEDSEGGPLPADSQAQYGGDCSSLNKEFGAVVKDVSAPTVDSATSIVECVAAPWFAEVEMDHVQRQESPQGSPYFMAQLKYTPPLPPSFASQVPTAVPLAPTRRAERGGDYRPPAKGDKATLLCLEKGKRLLFLRSTQNFGADPEFLPGPWSVEVHVEIFPDPLRVMGVGVQIRLVENLAVTMPPSRILPVTTAGLTDEQWLLLELADLRSQEQRQREAEDEANEAALEHWGELTQKLGNRTLTQMTSLPVGICRLRRGTGFDNHVFLDCLPPIQPMNKREQAMSVIDIVRRGIWGLALAVLPTMALNVPFHNLIKTEDGDSQSNTVTAVPNLNVFNIRRDWRMSLPDEATQNGQNRERHAELQARVWTSEQKELLELIAGEALQAYARGGKDRRKHTTEKHMKFFETDSKLVVRVSVAYSKRLNLLGLSKFRDAELVFTFTDAGHAFHPFHKIPTLQQPVRVDVQASAGADLNVAGGSAASPTPASLPPEQAANNQDNEERITFLQLLWQNVAEPQHQELRRIAIANVLWDIGLSAAFLVVAFLALRLRGTMNGRITAATLKDRRGLHFSTFETNDAAIVPGPKDEVQMNLADFDEFYGEEVAVSRTATVQAQKSTNELAALDAY